MREILDEVSSDVHGEGVFEDPALAIKLNSAYSHRSDYTNLIAEPCPIIKSESQAHDTARTFGV